MRKFEIYRRVLPSVGPIIFRNLFLLVNFVIFSVVVLLIVFGNIQAGIFLGIVFFLNTFISTAQDIRARVLLEKLQMLTALRVSRLNKDNTEVSILAEEIVKGDLLKLKLGDQVPCEGILLSSDNLEISEALVTGESDTFPKKEGDKIMAGAIVTSGYAVMEAQGLFRESRLSKISEDVKKYAANPSSIQRSINTVISYAGYILLAVIIFVVLRGVLVDASKLEIISNIGALASTIVPQGLIVVITLLFAIGAANYSKRGVLFQEINATEKLGRIKNLCIDKTGTLTDNLLIVEDMHLMVGVSEAGAIALVNAHIFALNDSSQTVLAIKKYIEENHKKYERRIEVKNTLSFSSWRRYSAVEIQQGNDSLSVFVGSPDIFMSRISKVEEKKWLKNVLENSARKGKRVLCVAEGRGIGLPKDISTISLSMIAIFVFSNNLRKGVKDTITFLQDRGVKIRVLSGDNVHTVRSVAESVGINGVENFITGKELEKWSDEDFKILAPQYTVFGQIFPEHKVKLVEEFKKDGFTAMVGDGVNDALAMKKADLGIAMFDGAPVTRQLADVVLMTNSFSDLPGAIKLADHFISSIEINSGVYINQSLAGLLFFILISLFGYAYPLTPLNITFINYFTVGFSSVLISYWALRPSRKILPANDKSFMKRVMPLVVYCAIVEAIVIALVFAFSPHSLKIASSNAFVGLAFIFSGFFFLIFAVKVYRGLITKKEKFHLAALGIFQVVLLYFAVQIPFIVHFFNIILP